MPLLLADGQLATTSTTILGAGTADRHIALTCFNTTAREQTIVVTVLRSGSTARQILRAVLKQYEGLYVRGLPLDPSDILAGYATGAASVDYIVSQTASAEPFSIFCRDQYGAPKQSSEITVTTDESFGLTRDGVAITGLLEEVRDLLINIASH